MGSTLQRSLLSLGGPAGPSVCGFGIRLDSTQPARPDARDRRGRGGVASGAVLLLERGIVGLRLGREHVRAGGVRAVHVRHRHPHHVGLARRQETCRERNKPGDHIHTAYRLIMNVANSLDRYGCERVMTELITGFCQGTFVDFQGGHLNVFNPQEGVESDKLYSIQADPNSDITWA